MTSPADKVFAAIALGFEVLFLWRVTFTSVYLYWRRGGYSFHLHWNFWDKVPASSFFTEP